MRFPGQSRIEKLKTAGNEAFAQGDHDAAIQSFSDAVKLDPQCVDFFLNKIVVVIVLRLW